MTNEELKKMLIELLEASFHDAHDKGKGIDVDCLDPENEKFFSAGYSFGFHEAISCVFFNVFGGKETFSLWWKNIDSEKAGGNECV